MTDVFGMDEQGQAAGDQAPRKAFSANAFRNLATRLKPAEAPPPTVPPITFDLPPAPFPPAPGPAFSASRPVPSHLVPIQPAPQPVSAAPPTTEPLFGPEGVNQEPTPEEEAARRLVELELENIWRLMLAKATPEDLEVYLSEAAEIMGDDPLYRETPPEPDADTALPDMGLHGGSLVRSLQPEETDTSNSSGLARALLDMMAASAGVPHERALAADTLLRLVPRLDLDTLVLLARRVAVMDAPPPLLVAKLIRDSRIEVSAPLLEDCAQILDSDLLTVIIAGEVGKLKLIARRRRISRLIAEALVKGGNAPALLMLVRNDEADISHDAMMGLVRASADHPELLAPLVNRRDMTAPLAFEAFWIAAPEVRRLIISRFLTDSEALGRILRITLATRDTSAQQDRDSSTQHIMLEALERAMRGNTEQAIKEMSAVLNVSPKTVGRILADTSGEALMVLLKAAGYPRGAIPAFLAKQRESEAPLVSPARNLEDLQALFEVLSYNKARILLTYWEWSETGTGPYAQLD